MTCFDYDNDGDQDIIIANRIVPQSYPVAAPSFLLRNDDGQLTDVTDEVFPDLKSNPKIFNDIQIADFDGDSRLDVMMLGEWSGINIFTNSDNQFVKSTEFDELSKLKGWWYSITPTDINGDGISDYVVGNVGTNIKHKATKDRPFKIYAEDFDETGSLDIVLTSHYNNQEVPVRGRECSSQQMPFIAEKFTSYNEFANASIIDIYGKDEVTNAYVREVVTFESIVLIGQSDGTLRLKKLPPKAQIFPVLDAESVDLNQDGYEDLILIGNIYNTEVETPRLDGGSGMVLLSDGNESYRYPTCPEFCFYTPGNAKAVTILNFKDQNYLIGISNNGPLSMFTLSE